MGTTRQFSTKKVFLALFLAYGGGPKSIKRAPYIALLVTIEFIKFFEIIRYFQHKNFWPRKYHFSFQDVWYISFGNCRNFFISKAIRRLFIEKGWKWWLLEKKVALNYILCFHPSNWPFQFFPGFMKFWNLKLRKPYQCQLLRDIRDEQHDLFLITKSHTQDIFNLS